MASTLPMNLTPDQICWNGPFAQPCSDDAPDFRNLHTDKNILVTGAGGSIGSALAKTIHRFRPRCPRLIDASEQALYRIYSDLSRAGSRPTSRSFSLSPRAWWRSTSPAQFCSSKPGFLWLTK